MAAPNQMTVPSVTSRLMSGRCWIRLLGHDPRKKNTTRSFNHILLAPYTSRRRSFFFLSIWRSIWQTKAFLRAACLPGSLLIHTMDDPRKYHITVVDRCFICRNSGKPVECLLLNCEVAKASWDGIGISGKVSQTLCKMVRVN